MALGVMRANRLLKFQARKKLEQLGENAALLKFMWVRNWLKGLQEAQ